jgi:hypothetical protein
MELPQADQPASFAMATFSPGADEGDTGGTVSYWSLHEPDPLVYPYRMSGKVFDERGRSHVAPTGVPLPYYMGGENRLIVEALWEFYGFPYLPAKEVSTGDKWTETVKVWNRHWKRQGWQEQVDVVFKWHFHSIEELQGRKCAKLTYEGQSDAKLFSWVARDDVPAIQCSGTWFFDLENGMDVYLWQEAQVIDLEYIGNYTFEKTL